jgi:hypothetical protein
MISLPGILNLIDPVIGNAMARHTFFYCARNSDFLFDFTKIAPLSLVSRLPS